MSHTLLLPLRAGARPLLAWCALALALCAAPATSAGAQVVKPLNATARAVNEIGARASTLPAAARPARRLASVKVTAEGRFVTRVRITSDSPLDDYAAYRRDSRFNVILPRVDASSVEQDFAATGLAGAEVERRGDDVLLSFPLEGGAAARVVQKFNQLDLFFVTQQQAPAGTAAQPARSPQQQSPAPTVSASPATDAPASSDPPAGVTNPTTAPSSAQPGATESATEAAKAVAGAPATTAGSRAARLAALLTPEKKNPVRISRFEQPPVIDGKLDEGVWRQAAVFKDFIQNRPGDLVPPSKQTEVLMGYDAKTLYIAFRAFDEPDKVRSTVAKRDAVFEDDWVGVVLDTFNDKRRAYELFFNPLGVQADAVLTSGGNEDLSVDVVMESKGSLTPEGYVVEVAVPFKSLRYVAGKNKVWGLHLLRAIKRFNDERSSWMPLSRDISGYLIQAGSLTGLEGLSTQRTLEVIPSLTLSESGRRINRPVPGGAASSLSPGGRMLNTPLELDPGISAKFGLTPQVTLDFTYNPDFAQVEADATVVTANQRFPIFFEEKRPFFLEGKEIFETLINAVHTRTIVDPDYASKLTGKRGRNTFGLLVASDDNPGNLTDDEETFLGETENRLFLSPDERARRESLLKFAEKNATVGVLRLKRDIGKENHIGFLGTTYNFVDKYNHVGGFDTRFRVNKTTTFAAQVLGSVSHQPFFYPEEGVRADRRELGMVYAAFLNSNGRNWGYEIGAVGRSRYFRADLGFNRRFNTNNPTVFVRYTSSEKPKNWLVNWRAYNFMGANFDWSGRSQRFVNESQLQMRLQRQTWVGAGFEKGYERVFEDEFGGTRAARRLSVAGIVGPERAAGLEPCDAFGGLPLLVEDDPATDADESQQHPRCTFYGGDNERSAYRTAVYFYVETAPLKQLSANVFTSCNRGVLDFDFGSGSPRFPRVSPAALRLGQGAPLDPGPGDEFSLQGGVTYKPIDPLNLRLNYTKSRLTRHDTGLTAFDDNIFSLRGTYQFTRFWFARARADYTTLGSRVRMQTLLGWTPNPGTTFYVGYNDDLNRHGFSPFTGELEPGFRRNGRTFFIKASYLFRKSF